MGIPDGWFDYTNMGSQIPGTRIIPFKTPLKKQSLLSRMSRNSPRYFDSQTLLDNCPSLGLVVDLTFTKIPYYSLEPLEKSGVQWTKLRIAGKMVPQAKDTKEFARIVEKFLAENQDNDKLIGVHCTHGLNRTGYIVCRYMMNQLGVPADQAIAAFQSARGHEIRSALYVSELRLSSRSLDLSLNSSVSQDESEGEVASTPPYMPHLRQSKRPKTRGVKRKSFSGGDFETQEIRYADCPLTGDSSVASYESSSTPSGSFQGKKRKSTLTFDDQTSSKMRLGKQYYDNYFKGQPQPQYEEDFYIRGGGGIGPHRPQSRCLTPYRGKWKQPHQYKGPRHPVSGRKKFNTPSNLEMTDGVNEPSGKSPSSMKKSPDLRSKLNPLSPDTPEFQYGRKRSGRFQPY